MGIDSLETVTYISYRFLIPAVLVAASFLRISLISLVWLLFFLALPCLPKYSYRNWIVNGSLKIYLIILLLISTLACCGHIVYFSLEFSNKVHVSNSTLCNNTITICRLIGYQSIDAELVPNILDRLRLVMPDFTVFFITVVTTLMCFNGASATSAVMRCQQVNPDKWNTSKLWRSIEPFVTVLFLFFTGAAAPSLVSGVYFTTFMLIATLWAFGIKFGKLPHLKLFLLGLSGSQLILLYLYQFQNIHSYYSLTPSSLTARLLGLVQYYDTRCDLAVNGSLIHNPLHLQFTDHLIIGNYAFVFCLIGLYFTLALSARYMIKISSTTSICYHSEEQPLLLDRARAGNAYNTIDTTVEDAASIRGSIRSRHSSFASSYQPEEEGTFTQIFNFLSRLLVDQVYLLTLAVLMLWSITYISWMEFVLLVLVCFLCICPKAKEASYSVAYPLVGYGSILVLIQYLYALDLTKDELEERNDIGLIRDPGGERGKPVLFKAIYLSVFWLHLRSCLLQQDQAIAGINIATLKHNRYTVKIYGLYRTIRHAILTYWPIVVYVLLTTASLHANGINIMRIIYLLFFSVFMFSYVISRKPLQLRLIWLWYLLITYSMICVILLYTFQFGQIRKLWTNNTETIADIGLSKTSSASNLFTQLLVPILVLLAVTIQLRVFRTLPEETLPEEPLEQEDVEEEEIEEEEQEEFVKKRQRLKSQTYLTNMANNLTETMKEFWSDSKTVAARAFHISLAIMEMHSPKLVSMAIFFVCIWRVNVINVVLLLVTVTTLPWPLIQYKLTIPIFCWVSWEIFSQLIYQLHMIQSLVSSHFLSYITIPCNNVTVPPLEPYQCGFKDKSDFKWLGYKKIDPGGSPWSLVWGYLLVISLLVIQRLLVHYMKGRRSPHVYILREGVFPDFVFPNINREDAESTFSFQLMYLCNNFFAMFGEEVVYIVHVIVAAVRFDIYGLIYIILLAVWKNLSNASKSKGCMPYIILINILISIQYLFYLGLPPGLCFEYPWCTLQTPNKISLLIWLFLPTTPKTTSPHFIFADFALLLCLTRQWHVFTLQKLDPTLAGALDDTAGPDYADPRNKSLLNRIKLFIFTYLWWVTAAVLFINAVMTISIFSVGFLLATFLLLWYGSSQLTKSKELLLKNWDKILVYTYLIILIKIVLQLFSCVTFHHIIAEDKKKDAIDRMLCLLADLFKLICLQNKPEELSLGTTPFMSCYRMSKTTGLTLDAITFAFVIVQMRVFNSPYFKHAQHYLTILMETSAQGAMIMNQRMTLRTKKSLDAQEKHLKHIKQHVAKLKAEHDSRKDFDFGTKELVKEAEEYWREREKKDTEELRQKSLSMYITQEELDSLSEEDISELDSQVHVSDVSLVEKKTKGKEGCESSNVEGDDPTDTSETFKSDPETDGKPVEVPIWQPKPPKPEKPTEEIVVDFLEFSHDSLIGFIEFTIRWLDDKSGDYRYTSAAIFQERYNVLDNPNNLSNPSTINIYTDTDTLEDVPPSSAPNEHLVIRLVTALYYFCLARTELLCFLFMILNHFMNASLISMFYPLIAFLWGMVAFPRPSGIFWYTVIIYCKVTIIIKYIFQFNSIHWNSPAGPEAADPMWAPNMLGLTKTNQLILKTMWDLLILMSVFFHISCLETAGIWSLWYNTFEDLEDENLEKIVTSSITTTPKEDETKETSLNAPVESLTDNCFFENQDPENGDAYEQNGDTENSIDFTALAKINFVIFWKLLVDKRRKDMPKDLYMPMLLSSLLALLITVLGWNSFGKVEGQDMFDVSEIISTNYIPSVFLIILLIQFMLMIIDRIIYLKQSMLSKYCYQVIVVLVVHSYMFMFQPWFTKEFFKSVPAWIGWYLFFCIYFTLSAFQVQAGYPHLKTDSIVLRTYGYVTYVIYLGYLAVPFLWELEVLLNWVCTETTLTLDYWIKYSDIKAYLFKLKCWQVTYESSYYLGEKQPAYMKYGIGGLLVLLLILIIWFPLLFMSVVTTNSVSNPPVGFSYSLSISGLQPLVTVNVAQMPEPLSDTELDYLKSNLTSSYNSTSGLNNYTEYINRLKSPDVTRLDLSGDSTTLWEISPASVKGLKSYLQSEDDSNYHLSIIFSWTITRAPDSTSADISVYGRRELHIRKSVDPEHVNQTYVDKSELLKVLENCSARDISVNLLVPTFFLAKEKGASLPGEIYPKDKWGVDTRNFKNVTLVLQHETDETPNGKCRLWNGYYWSVNQSSPYVQQYSNPVNLSNNTIQFYIISERIVSSQYQLIASYGIIGLYISVVLVIFKFIRLVLADSSTRIIFQEMPCPDLIHQLVASTEMVRAQCEFVLEQVLFRKLLLLYRSPETLIMWTGRHRHLKEE